MSPRVDRRPHVTQQRQADLATLLEHFGALRQSAGMCQHGSPEQQNYLDVARQIADQILATKLDDAFGEHTRPNRCHECHAGVHTHVGACSWCRCGAAVSAPDAGLMLVGGQA